MVTTSPTKPSPRSQPILSWIFPRHVKLIARNIITWRPRGSHGLQRQTDLVWVPRTGIPRLCVLRSLSEPISSSESIPGETRDAHCLVPLKRHSKRYQDQFLLSYQLHPFLRLNFVGGGCGFDHFLHISKVSGPG